MLRLDQSLIAVAEGRRSFKRRTEQTLYVSAPCRFGAPMPRLFNIHNDEGYTPTVAHPER